tara:strand:- start:65 stop:424 length:360 start_codon:yes stop_codon:yes gene_type:complete
MNPAADELMRRLRATRAERKHTLAFVARMLRCSPGTVKKYERGEWGDGNHYWRIMGGIVIYLRHFDSDQERLEYLAGRYLNHPPPPVSLRNLLDRAATLLGKWLMALIVVALLALTFLF